jgi:hypothetical protein
MEMLKGGFTNEKTHFNFVTSISRLKMVHETFTVHYVNQRKTSCRLTLKQMTFIITDTLGSVK